jgi:hypothetical protein
LHRKIRRSNSSSTMRIFFLSIPEYKGASAMACRLFFGMP